MRSRRGLAALIAAGTLATCTAEERCLPGPRRDTAHTLDASTLARASENCRLVCRELDGASDAGVGTDAGLDLGSASLTCTLSGDRLECHYTGPTPPCRDTGCLPI